MDDPNLATFLQNGAIGERPTPTRHLLLSLLLRLLLPLLLPLPLSLLVSSRHPERSEGSLYLSLLPLYLSLPLPLPVSLLVTPIHPFSWQAPIIESPCQTSAKPMSY
jgi:hypothetical protein